VTASLPLRLLDCYPTQLPDATLIQEEMGKVWGFDFYLPSQLMLLRFERDFHDKYISNTFRHETFKKISYQKAKNFIQNNLHLNHPEMLLQILTDRSPDDAYYCVNYRDGDINVIHRLRSWRPHVEILLPEQLRQQFRQEIRAETQFYLSP
jgi:CRISPR-associated protein (TIGR03985 family)